MLVRFLNHMAWVWHECFEFVAESLLYSASWARFVVIDPYPSIAGAPKTMLVSPPWADFFQKGGKLLAHRYLQGQPEMFF